MKKNIKKNYKKIKDFFETKELFIAYLLLAFVFFGTAFTFFTQNNLLGWDHYAHVDAARFIKENTWPLPSGWNPEYFNGYPQNIFYPPLLSWTVATISFIFPVEISYKFLLIFLYFLAPVLFYRFAKIFGDKKTALELNLFLVLTMFIPDWLYYGTPVGIGGTVSSTFYVGLGAAFMGFLFLVYFITEYEKRVSPLKTGIIFAFGILAHYVFIIVFIYLLLDLINKKNLKQFLVTISVGIITSAFWWGPAIIFRNYLMTANFIIPMINITVIIMALGILVILMKKCSFEERKFFTFGIFLFLLVFVFEEALIKGQLFRVFFALVFFSTPIIYSYFRDLKYKKIKKYIPLVIVLFILVYSLTIDFTSQSFIEFTTPVEKTNNLYIVMGPNDQRESHHTLFYEYVNYSNNRILRGLFSEQSPNIVFNSGLYLYINPNEFIWGTIAVKGDAIQREQFNELLDFFGVRSIITTEGINKDINFLKLRYLGTQYVKIDIQKILWYPIGEAYQKRNIVEYYFSEPKMVEVVKEDPLAQADDKDWMTFSSNFLAADARVITKEFMTGYKINKDANITSIERTNTTIKVHVDSDVNVPILFKESYFPNWKAYVNGVPTKIYLTAPYFMTVVGKGDIELKYERSFEENITLLISVITFLICIGFLKIKNIRKINKYLKLNN